MATKPKTQAKAPEAEITDEPQGENTYDPALEKAQSDEAVAATEAAPKPKGKPTPEPAKEDPKKKPETPEEMEARIRSEVLETIRQEELEKDEERLRAKLLAELRLQKVEEEAEKKASERKSLELFLDDPEDDFFTGKVAVVVETKNIHDGQGNKYAGITRMANGMAAFAAPVHFMSESFAKTCIDNRIARSASPSDAEDRLELIIAQEESADKKGK